MTGFSSQTLKPMLSIEEKPAVSMKKRLMNKNQAVQKNGTSGHKMSSLSYHCPWVRFGSLLALTGYIGQLACQFLIVSNLFLFFPPVIAMETIESNTNTTKDTRYYYTDEDIETCINARISCGAEVDRAPNCTYLLKPKGISGLTFFNQAGKPYYAALLPSCCCVAGITLATNGIPALPVTYCLDKANQTNEYVNLLTELLDCVDKASMEICIAQRKAETGGNYGDIESILQIDADAGNAGEISEIKGQLSRKLSSYRRLTKDVFDELLFQTSDVSHAHYKIIFPFCQNNRHWYVGEILGEKNGINDYSFTIMAHNPYGGGNFGETFPDDAVQIHECLTRRLSLSYLALNTPSSPYVPRQESDSISCGPIIVDDLFKIILGRSLDVLEPYGHGALLLRKQHIQEIKDARDIQHPAGTSAIISLAEVDKFLKKNGRWIEELESDTQSINPDQVPVNARNPTSSVLGPTDAHAIFPSSFATQSCSDKVSSSPMPSLSHYNWDETPPLTYYESDEKREALLRRIIEVTKAKWDKPRHVKALLYQEIIKIINQNKDENFKRALLDDLRNKLKQPEDLLCCLHPQDRDTILYKRNDPDNPLTPENQIFDAIHKLVKLIDDVIIKDCSLLLRNHLKKLKNFYNNFIAKICTAKSKNDNDKIIKLVSPKISLQWEDLNWYSLRMLPESPSEDGLKEIKKRELGIFSKDQDDYLYCKIYGQKEIRIIRGHEHTKDTDIQNLKPEVFDRLKKAVIAGESISQTDKNSLLEFMSSCSYIHQNFYRISQDMARKMTSKNKYGLEEKQNEAGGRAVQSCHGVHFKLLDDSLDPARPGLEYMAYAFGKVLTAHSLITPSIFLKLGDFPLPDVHDSNCSSGRAISQAFINKQNPNLGVAKQILKGEEIKFKKRFFFVQASETVGEQNFDQFLKGCYLNLMLEKDMPEDKDLAKYAPAIVKLENNTYDLIVNTLKGARRISNLQGIEPDELADFFQKNLDQRKKLFKWRDPLSGWEDPIMGYGLHLMSELPKDGKPLKGKIYLECSGNKLKYKALDHNKDLIEGKLDITGGEKLTPDTLRTLKPRISEELSKTCHAVIMNYVTAKGGHTYFSYNYNDVTMAWQVIFSLLTLPADGKADNYSLKDGHLIGIDDDKAFLYNSAYRTESGNLYTSINCILYCIEQVMGKRLNEDVKKTFLEINPSLVILHWLGCLADQDRHYYQFIKQHIESEGKSPLARLESLSGSSSHSDGHKPDDNQPKELSSPEQKKFEKFKLITRLPLDITKQIKKRMEDLQVALQDNPYATPDQLFHKLFEIIAAYYKKIRTQYPNPNHAMLVVYKAINENGDSQAINAVLGDKLKPEDLASVPERHRVVDDDGDENNTERDDPTQDPNRQDITACAKFFLAEIAQEDDFEKHLGEILSLIVRYFNADEICPKLPEDAWHRVIGYQSEHGIYDPAVLKFLMTRDPEGVNRCNKAGCTPLDEALRYLIDTADIGITNMKAVADLITDIITERKAWQIYSFSDKDYRSLKKIGHHLSQSFWEAFKGSQRFNSNIGCIGTLEDLFPFMDENDSMPEGCSILEGKLKNRRLITGYNFKLLPQNPNSALLNQINSYELGVYLKDDRLYCKVADREELEIPETVGCNLYLMAEKDLPKNQKPVPEHTPAIIKLKSNEYNLIVKTSDVVREIPIPKEIDVDALNLLFQQNSAKGRVSLSWDDPIMQVIVLQGDHTPIPLSEKIKKDTGEGTGLLTPQDRRDLLAFTRSRNYTAPEVKSHLEDPRNKVNHGRSEVLRIEENGRLAFVKFIPGLPGLEEAIGSLTRQTIGFGASPGELFRFPDGRPVWISHGIQGDTLQRVLENNPDRLKELDQGSVMKLIIMAMLLNPEDGKPDNYIVEPLPGNPNAFRLSCPDNEQGLVQAFVKTTPEEGEVVVQVKTALYCLDQMMEDIPPNIVNFFINQDLPSVLLEKWLQKLRYWDERYQALFSSEEREELLKERGQAAKDKQCYIDVAFQEQMIKHLYTKWNRLRDELQKSRAEGYSLKPFDLLSKLEPHLAHRYRTVFEKNKTALDRFEEADKKFYLKGYETVTKTNSMLRSFGIATNEKPLLQVVTEKGNYSGINAALKGLAEIKKQENQSGTVASKIVNMATDYQREKFLESFDFSTFNAKEINGFLSELHPYASGLRHLALKNCRYLGNRQLEEFLQSGNLVVLDLKGCDKVTHDTLSILSKNHPGLENLNLPKCSKIAYFAVYKDYWNQYSDPIVFRQLRHLNLNKCASLCSIKLVAPNLRKLYIKSLKKLAIFELEAPMLEGISCECTPISFTTLCDLIPNCPQLKKVEGDHMRNLWKKFAEDNPEDARRTWPSIHSTKVNLLSRILALAYQYDLKGMSYQDFGGNLYIILKEHLPETLKPVHAPTIVKLKDGKYDLIVKNGDELKRIPVPGGIHENSLEPLFQENPTPRRVFKSWGDPIMEGIIWKGSHFKGNLIQPQNLVRINIMNYKVKPGFLKSLKDFSSLTELLLVEAGLTNLSGFPEIETLEVLNLSNNGITSLSGLPILPNLKVLNISKNKITNLSGLHTDLGIHPKSPGLIELNISENNIKFVNREKNYIFLLRNLCCLDISHNNLHNNLKEFLSKPNTLSSSCILNLPPNLNKLNLEGNYIQWDNKETKDAFEKQGEGYKIGTQKNHE